MKADSLRLGIWHAFQLLVGGTLGKRRLALSRYGGQRRVLEIGCATGNVSAAFRRFSPVEFVGLDIDAAAVEQARRRFAGDSRFRFVVGEAGDLSAEERCFDYVLLAGVLHHMDDLAAAELTASAARLVAPGGILLAYEPMPPAADAPWVVRLYGRIERGDWLRPPADLVALLRAHAAGLALVDASEHPIAPFLGKYPQCARFAVVSLRRPT